MDEKKMENNTVVKPSGDGNEKTGLQALLTKRNIIIMALALIVAVVLLVVLTSSPSPKAVIGELKLGMKPEKVVELIGEPNTDSVKETGEGYYRYKLFELLGEKGSLSIQFKNNQVCYITWTSDRCLDETSKAQLFEKLSDYIFEYYGKPNNDHGYNKWWKIGKGKGDFFVQVREPITGNKEYIEFANYNIKYLND